MSPRVPPRRRKRTSSDTDDDDRLPQNRSVYQFQGMIGTKDEQQPDLDVHLIWRYFGYHVEREDLETDFEAAPEPERVAAGSVSA